MGLFQQFGFAEAITLISLASLWLPLLFISVKYPTKLDKRAEKTEQIIAPKFLL